MPISGSFTLDEWQTILASVAELPVEQFDNAEAKQALVTKIEAVLQGHE